MLFALLCPRHGFIVLPGEEGGGAEKGEEGSKEGGEKESGDSDIDVPLAQRKRKVARV